MKVLQLIDSLTPGGAEQMAVAYANLLSENIEGSFLCCTRKEGFLKEKLQEKTGYIFLNKKRSLDWKAFGRLRKFVRSHKIDIVHAHSTSFFFAGLLKLTGCPVKVIWHDHYGESDYLEKRKFRVLKRFSGLFDGIISVNSELKEWAVRNLQCKNIIVLNNFVSEEENGNPIKLKGAESDFRVICVANLRPQKDHQNLLKAMEKVSEKYSVSLHLIGEDPGTSYSSQIKKLISDSVIRNKVYLYGSQPSVLSLLKQADLGVLSSRSEGLPLAILEYGLAGLPVVSTEVGQVNKVVDDHALLVPKEDPKALAKAIMAYLEDEKLRRGHARSFNLRIDQHYSKDAVKDKILEFYNTIVDRVFDAP